MSNKEEARKAIADALTQRTGMVFVDENFNMTIYNQEGEDSGNIRNEEIG